MKKYLIACLGNIGAEYANTRHNIGFLVADTLVKDHNASFTTQKLGDLAEIKVKGRTFILLKPSTYMNLSGKAVRYWMEKENIPLENLLVICDDLNIPFGTIRIKGKGSDGGHNGLKDIQAQLNTQQYARLRFGISSNFESGKQIDYVLGEWTPEEQTLLPERLEKCAEAVISYGLAGLNITMNIAVNQLDEVQVSQYRKLSAQDLGILQHTPQERTFAEKRLYASKGLGIVSILNTLSGQKKIIKKIVANEKNLAVAHYIRENMAPFLQKELKLNEEEIDILAYFVMERPDFHELVRKKDNKPMEFMLLEAWNELRAAQANN